LAPIARQRAVYAVLGDAMRSRIHALALRTLTPEEWARERP
jgi:acid stress-induced BolA-like protein IbaG/YrbA